MSSFLCKFKKFFGGGKPPRFYTGTLLKVNSLKCPLKALPVHRLFHALSDKRNQAFIYNIKKHKSSVNELFLIKYGLNLFH